MSKWMPGDGEKVWLTVCREHELDPDTIPPKAQRLSDMLAGPIGFAAAGCGGNPGILLWVSAILETHARIARQISEQSFDEIAESMGFKSEDD